MVLPLVGTLMEHFFEARAQLGLWCMLLRGEELHIFAQIWVFKGAIPLRKCSIKALDK